MPLFSKPHESFVFTIQVHRLMSDEQLPTHLTCEWRRGSRRSGNLSMALVTGAKAVWDQSFTVPATLYREKDSQAFQSKMLSITIVNKGTVKKSLGSVSIDLSLYATLDGKTPLECSLDSAASYRLMLTVGCLWVRKVSKSKSQCSFLSSERSSCDGEADCNIVEDSSHHSHNNHGHGMYNPSAQPLQRIMSESASPEADQSSMAPIPSISSERAMTLLKACGYGGGKGGGYVGAEDILFLFARAENIEKEKVMVALTVVDSKPAAASIKEKKENRDAIGWGECRRMLNTIGINAPLFARLLDDEDVGNELQQLFDCDPLSVEFYLLQFVSLLMYRSSSFPHLRKLLIKMCSNSVHLALHTMWIAAAMISPSPKTPQLQSEGQLLQQQALEAVRAFDGYTGVSIDDVIWFSNALIQAAVAIGPIPPEARAAELRVILQKINQELDSRCVYLPFCVLLDDHHRVARIAWEESIVFKTWSRAPFMIFIEVVSTNTRLRPSDAHLSNIKPSHAFAAAAAAAAVASEPEAIDIFNAQNNTPSNESGIEIEVSDSQHQRAKLQKLKEMINFDLRRERIQERSAIGSAVGWELLSCVVKDGDDLRQERFASQLILQFARIFDEFKLPLYVHPYNVLPISPTAGFIETVPSAVTLDTLKKTFGQASLLEYFTSTYGGRKSPEFREAQSNFVRSMAGYSLVCYLLQVKDRHGGNIMLDKYGHIIHIDFGFMLSKQQPSTIERAPFKLTAEFVEVMGGVKSSAFREYKSLMRKGFRKLRKRYYTIEMLVRAMHACGSPLPCVNTNTVNELLTRFHLYMNKEEVDKIVNALIKHAMGSISTSLYDWLQKALLGTAT